MSLFSLFIPGITSNKSKDVIPSGLEGHSRVRHLN